ncbi:MAG: helix-turn-helix domain-containing protein [Clostridiales bacterium]|jgi:transcriptional regulator with XRE-family HTH domain|nr:helix-turn-helix domain-containing protein [Clostridiales bacterium]
MISERIKELRKLLGLTQNQFGAQIGLAGSTVCDIEKGKITNVGKQSFLLICRTFDVRSEWLGTGHGDIFDENNIGSIFEKYKSLNDGDKEYIRNMIDYLLSHSDRITL